MTRSLPTGLPFDSSTLFANPDSPWLCLLPMFTIAVTGDRPAVEHDAGTGLPAHHAAQWLARLASGLGGGAGNRDWHHGTCAGGSAGAVCAAERLGRAVRRHQADGGALSGLPGAFHVLARYQGSFRHQCGCGVACAFLWPDLSAGPADQCAQSQGSTLLLFFLAFVPQFIDPAAPQKAMAFIVLGCIFNINGMIWCHLLAFSTAYASRKMRLPARLGCWLNRVMGGLFVGLGIKLAVE